MSEVKGKIIIIKRNGQDRVTYPLMSNSCLFGSGLDCDIRVQLPSVSERHCVLKVGPKDKVFLTSLSHGNTTLLNDIPVTDTVAVNHKDILTVVDRSFRFEYPPKSAHYSEDDSCVLVPEVKSLKVLSPREKPPVFQVNGTPGKMPLSLKKKVMRKSLGSADVHIFTDGELTPLSRPRRSYSRKSPSPRSLTLSARQKRVSFGPALSPEQFDRNMPPATPVRRGSLPRRHAATPDYFGSPIITQYPRPKKNRLSAIPREQSIAEEILETSEAVSQLPRHKYDVSPKSLSPLAINKSSPKTKGSSVKVLQQEDRNKTAVTKKSPLARKSPKSASPSPLARKSPKSVSPSPLKKPPKSVSPSPLKKPPKSVSPSPLKKSPKSVSPSPLSKSPKSVSLSPLSKSPKSVSPSPLSKSPKSVSPIRSPVPSAGKGKMNLDTDTEVAVPLSSSLSDSPKQTVINADNSSPFKSQHNTSKKKVSPSKLSPLKVLTSAVSPSSKHTSPLSRRKSSVQSSVSSIAVTPSRSLKTQVTDKRASSSGKKSSRSHAVKRLSAGKSPVRPVSLSTPSRKSPVKSQKKTSAVSKVRYSHPAATPSLEENSFIEKPLNEVLLSEGQNTGDDFGNAVLDSLENSSSHVTTPKISLKRQQGRQRLSSGKRSSSSHLLKNLSVKSPTRTPSPRTPAQKTPGKISEKGSSKLRRSFLSMSDSSAKEMSKSETSFSEGHSGKVGNNDADSSQFSFSDKTVQGNAQTPVSGRKLKSRTTPKSSRKRQNSLTDTASAPDSGRSVSEAPDAKQVISEGTGRVSQSPVLSAKKKVSSPLRKTPSVTTPKTPGSKRKANFPLSSESAKKTRLSASLSSNLSTPSSKVSPKSHLLLPEAKSPVLPKEVSLNPSPTTPEDKTGHGTPSELKTSANRVLYKTKVTLLDRKNKTPVKTSPQFKSSLSPPNESTKPQSSKIMSGSKVRQSSVRVNIGTPARSSPLAKSPSAAANLKFSTPAKKVTPVMKKSSAKKAVPIPRSLKKIGTPSSSRSARSARSVKKVFSIKKSSKKPLWTDIVRRGIMKKKVTSKPKVVRTLLSNAIKTKKVFKSSGRKLLQKPMPATNKKVTSVTSTGHAESPETIVIQKRRSILSKTKEIKTSNVEDLQSPDSTFKTDIRDTSGKVTPLRSSLKSRKSSSASRRKTPLSHQKDSSYISPVSTPNITRERFVSPLTTPRVSRKNSSLLEKYVLENQHMIKTVSVKGSRKSETFVGVKRLLKSGTPKADYSNVAGIKRLVKTPKSLPKADYSDVRGIKKLAQTPKGSPKADYSDVRGIKKLVQTPKDSPKADYRDVRGIKKLVQTPKGSPKADYRDVRGIRRLVKTPKDSPAADYRNVDGVKNLLRTPASAKRATFQAKTVSIKQLYQNRTPPADYTKVKGVKQLFKASRPTKGKARARKTKSTETVREPDFTNVEGVKQLFREPEENEFNISGLQQLFSPVPTVSFGAKTDILSPSVQEASPLTQKVSSPKSRRKQSFGSSLSATSLDENSMKTVCTTSPASQENTSAVVEDVAVSPPKARESSGRRVADTPVSTGKASRSSRSFTAILPQQQTPDPLHSPPGRKSTATVISSGTPITKSPKVRRSVTAVAEDVAVSPPKARESSGRRVADTPVSTGKASRSSRTVTAILPQQQTPDPLLSPPGRKSSATVISSGTPTTKSPKAGRSVNSPLQAVLTAPSPSVTTPRTRQKTPQSAKDGSQKYSPLQKSTGKEEKSSAEASKTESPSAVQNVSPVSSPHKAKKGANRAPEVIVISDDDDVTGEQKPKRGGRGRSAATTSKPKAAAHKGSKRSVNQEMPDSAEVQQAVSHTSPRKSGRQGAQSKTVHATEISIANKDVPNDFSGGRRATRSKASDAKEGEGGQNATGARVPKGGRSKKNNAVVDEMLEHSQEQTSYDAGGRASRRKAVVLPEPVDHSSAILISPPKIGNRGKTNKFLPAEMKEDSLHLSGDEHNEVREVKVAKRTRGRGQAQAVNTPVKNEASKSVMASANEHKAGKVPRRGAAAQAMKKLDLLSSDDLSESSADVTADIKALPRPEVSTAPSKRRTVNKQIQDNLANDVVKTSSSAKLLKTRKNQKLSVNSEDNTNVVSETVPEVLATPERSTRSKKTTAKSKDVSSSVTAESVERDINMPSLSKQPKSRRNQKALQDETESHLNEGSSTSTGTRRSKRGRQQDSENAVEVLPKQPRTRDQKNVVSFSSAESSSASIDSTDASDTVRRPTRGRTAKINTSLSETEMPDAKRPKRQTKKSGVNDKDSTESQVDVNETAVPSEKQAAESPSSHSVRGKKGRTQSERPKRVGRTARGTSSMSSDDTDTEAVNSKRLRAKRSRVDSDNDAVSPKRTRKETAGAETVENATKVAKVQPKSSKTRSPVLEAIPEVEEEVTVTPTVKKATRGKNSAKQTTKESPVRRPTRSRRK